MLEHLYHYRGNRKLYCSKVGRQCLLVLWLKKLQTRQGEVKRVASLGVDFRRRQEKEEVEHLG